MYISNSKGFLVNTIAGLFVLLSVIFGFTVHEYAFFFTGWVGIMLVVASLTGFCPMYAALRKMGVGADVNVQDKLKASSS